MEEGNHRKNMRPWKQRIMAVMLGAVVLGSVPSASAQSRDDFSYWDANGNGDLTCSEALGRDEGLRLPAYKDDRDGTGIIYEWLERTRSSDSDNDGIACDSSSNPGGYIPRAQPDPQPTGCPPDAETWRGLKVCSERPRDSYDRDGYGTGYSSLEDEIIAALPSPMKKNGQVYTPYSCIAFDITMQGTAATDIEHIVALAEAHDSGIADDRRRDIASDLDNLTIADPMVNRSEKSDQDAGEWMPDRHGAWFAQRVIAVKREYELSVDPAERDALEMLLAGGEAELNCVGAVAPGVVTLEFAHFANGSSITSDLVLVNVAPHPIRPELYFYDREGDRIAAESVVGVTGELEVTEDGSLSVQPEMQPLEALTISTHGQGELVAGSVTVFSNGPIGGVLRFDLPGVGVAGVGASQPLTDALFPARRQEGAISTAAAIRNLEEEELVVSCRLMKEGAVLEEVDIKLQANGQDGRFIEEVFTRTDTSDFVGLVRCTAEGEFAGVAVELDAGNRIFTTLAVVRVEMTSPE